MKKKNTSENQSYYANFIVSIIRTEQIQAALQICLPEDSVRYNQC